MTGGVAAEVEVVDPGLSTSIQDRGRPGLAHLGVTSSGFVDPGLASLVNRLVGNDDDAAVLETVGNLTLRASTPVLVADSRTRSPVILRPGQVHVVPPDDGSGRVWHYVAIRGGISVPGVLGSRSRDTLAGIGPPILMAGARLPIGPNPRRPVAVDVAPLPELPATARVTAGPRTEWFAPGWERSFTAADWTVVASSRIGVRLAASRPPERVRDGELASEGLVRGAIQVPPDGDPIMMLADHPTTGGYPVIAVVDPADVPIVAQHPPGRPFRFRL